jgi:hypothetical protein
MAVLVGIYTFLYFISGAAVYNVMWLTFVSLPIYFGGGGKVEEFPHFFVSAVSGVIWGLLILKGAGIFASAGMSITMAMTLAVAIGTFLSVGLHLCILSNTWFGKVTMVFGGAAALFSQGGTNLIPLIGTLTCGLILTVLITLGGNILQKYTLSEKVDEGQKA